MPTPKARSNKSYVILEGKHDRAPSRRATLITNDADFGVVEVVTDLPKALIVAYRESNRGKPKWVNASVTKAPSEAYRSLHAQAGESVSRAPVPVWLDSPLCKIGPAPRRAA